MQAQLHDEGAPWAGPVHPDMRDEQLIRTGGAIEDGVSSFRRGAPCPATM